MVVLASTALAAWVCHTIPDAADSLKWLSNLGAHGFSTILYEFISAATGYGSGYEALGDNTPFWNLMPCLAMLSGRFVPIVGGLMLVAELLTKSHALSSVGSIRLENFTFALLFFLALTLEPLAEFFAGR